VVLKLGGLGEVLTTPSRENIHVMNYPQDEMLPLEIKQSGGKLLPHSVLRGGGGGGFQLGLDPNLKKRKRDILLGTWNVRTLYNIKMDVQEVGGGRGDWMELAQHRDGWRALVSTVKNLRVP
jgi:hypothetical protein